MYTQKTVSNFYNNGCNFFQAQNFNIGGFNSLNLSSIFTNCFGEYNFTNCVGEWNYNAMMGASVITSLINTGAMYFSSKSEEKAEAKSELDDKKARVAEIDNQIAELSKNKDNNKIQKLKAEKERLEQEINQANFYSYCNRKKLKKEDYDKLFTIENNSTVLSNEHERITSGAIRTATTKFITSTGEDKQQAANEFMALWEEYRYQDNIPTIELKMYNTISRYLDNNPQA